MVERSKRQQKKGAWDFIFNLILRFYFNPGFGYIAASDDRKIPFYYRLDNRITYLTTLKPEQWWKLQVNKFYGVRLKIPQSNQKELNSDR